VDHASLIVQPSYGSRFPPLWFFRPCRRRSVGRRSCSSREARVAVSPSSLKLSPSALSCSLHRLAHVFLLLDFLGKVLFYLKVIIRSIFVLFSTFWDARPGYICGMRAPPFGTSSSYGDCREQARSLFVLVNFPRRP